MGPLGPLNQTLYRATRHNEQITDNILKTNIIAVALLIATPAASETKAYAPEDYDKAWVKVTDFAKHGCWTNIGEVTTYTEDQLRLAGFNVVDEPVAQEGDPNPLLTEDGIAVWINVNGERLSNGTCVGYIDATFFAEVINPNRDMDIGFVSPMGLPAQPYLMWTSKNFNTYALDFMKVTIKTWVERGIFQ